MPELILASTSRYRQVLLERLGLPFTACPPACDEDALKQDGLAPMELACQLAAAKAASVAAGRADAVVIGSDQVAAIDGEILGKPGDRATALAQLGRLAGRSHRLITAVCIIAPQGRWQHCDETTLHMAPLASEALERYLDRDQPFDCAGSYKLEAGGIALFDRIDSQDHSAITGLPLLAVGRHLRELGFAFP